MEGEEIGMVLERASELRSKFNDSIDRLGVNRGPQYDPCCEATEQQEQEGEAESLIVIRDALESLEQQLSSLQALQQQQRYEREEALTKIDRGRMILLNKLEEYKGDDLEVIHEALTFASGTLGHGDDLLLPPYPSHLPDLFVLDDLHSSSCLQSKYKFSQNGHPCDHKIKRSINGSEEKQSNHPPNRSKPKGIGHVVGLLGKSVLAFVGVVFVLRLAGFKPIPRKDSTQFRIQELFQMPAGKAKEDWIQGKVLDIENGKPRRLVKERAELPFELDVTSPKISYGFG